MIAICMGLRACACVVGSPGKERTSSTHHAHTQASQVDALVVEVDGRSHGSHNSDDKGQKQ
jgi:hypothetical protein